MSFTLEDKLYDPILNEMIILNKIIVLRSLWRDGVESVIRINNLLNEKTK